MDDLSGSATHPHRPTHSADHLSRQCHSGHLRDPIDCLFRPAPSESPGSEVHWRPDRRSFRDRASAGVILPCAGTPMTITLLVTLTGRSKSGTFLRWEELLADRAASFVSWSARMGHVSPVGYQEPPTKDLGQSDAVNHLSRVFHLGASSDRLVEGAWIAFATIDARRAFTIWNHPLEAQQQDGRQTARCGVPTGLRLYYLLSSQTRN